MSLLGELKRRKLIQVAAVYAVVAWLFVQIVVTIRAPQKESKAANAMPTIFL